MNPRGEPEDRDPSDRTLVAAIEAQDSDALARLYDRHAPRLLGVAVPFGLGLIPPILLFLVPYIRGGGFDELYHGLVVLTQRHIARPPANPLAAVAALPSAVAPAQATVRPRSFIPTAQSRAAGGNLVTKGIVLVLIAAAVGTGAGFGRRYLVGTTH